MGHGGNNPIPNVHFRKVNGCQIGRFNRVYLKAWHNQAARKHRRAIKRQKKAAKIAPRPIAGKLRPLVHPPTAKYNMKLRLGRGFTFEELKEAGIQKEFAKTIGIAVDHRRRNKCVESLQLNVERLKTYMSKIVIFPRKSGKKNVKKGDTPRTELGNVSQNTLKHIIPIPQIDWKDEPRAITAAEKEQSAYKILKKARTNQKYLGERLKKAQKTEADA
mmetsp:Transcript_53416/g.127394  ORF Transcript_53416/g.127394 Transcript_53416/m.127394 type:complete len:218 (-) Transcript_53416:83-736(-)